jgi:hypothetical protein
VSTSTPAVNFRVRSHPGWSFLIFTAVLTAVTLQILGLCYPPGPLGQLPYGPVSLSLSFPSHLIIGREPILSGGVKGATYILSIEEPGPGQVRFVYEAWGSSEQVSGPVAVVPGAWYHLAVDMPQLRAPSNERGVPLDVTLNGNPVMHGDIPYAQLAVKSLWIGTNPLNGPYMGRDPFPGPPKPYAFSGQIRDIRRLPASSPNASFLTDRLFANLRYEVEIAPHILYWSVLAGFLAAFGIVLRVLPAGAERRVFVRRMLYYLTPLAITALPVLPLLQISRTFRADWLNHGWIMEYYGQYLSVHHWFPRVVNSRQITGMPSPLFYGHLLYSIGGLFNVLVGGNAGIRLALFTALLCQTLCVRRTVWRLTGSLAAADAVSAMVCWAIYPFSNLYGGSVMEFMAVCYLSCCVCIFFDFCRDTGSNTPWLAIAEFALFYVLAASHPITGLFGGLMLAAMAFTAFALSPSRVRIAKSLVAAALLILVMLSPWLYMYAHYGSQLFIGKATASQKLEYHEFDTLVARLSPFAYDAKSIGIGALSETSYADMQLNLALLLAAIAGVLFAGTAKRAPRQELGAKGLIFLGWSVLGWALAASINPAVAAFSAALTGRLQFAFRLINFQNLALLLIVLAWCWLYGFRGAPRRGIRYRVWLPSFCSALLAVSAVSMLEKWVHGAAAVEQSAIGNSPEQALTLPYTFYWLTDYVGAVPDITVSPAPKQTINFKVREGSRFGEVEPADIELTNPKWVVIDTTPLPVNRIYVDGAQVPPGKISRNAAYSAVQMLPGKHHIEYRFLPGVAWNFLRGFTELLFWGLTLACLYREFTAPSHPFPSSASRRSPGYTH